MKMYQHAFLFFYFLEIYLALDVRHFEYDGKRIITDPFALYAIVNINIVEARNRFYLFIWTMRSLECDFESDFASRNDKTKQKPTTNL